MKYHLDGQTYKRKCDYDAAAHHVAELAIQADHWPVVRTHRGATMVLYPQYSANGMAWAYQIVWPEDQNTNKRHFASTCFCPTTSKYDAESAAIRHIESIVA